MKIHQLPMGTRFRYQGQDFVKCGPMFATDAKGQRQMIPRHAVLQLEGEVPVIPVSVAEALDRQSVIEAFATFYLACHELVAEDRLPALDAARREFLRCLEKS